MKRKGFTLIELLIVIAIIALLMSILMPALAKARELAIRLVCGTNLKGLGSAMAIYAHENDDSFPVAGPSGTMWTDDGYIKKWNTGPEWKEGATISSSLYLLVLHTKVTTKQFVCQGDADTRVFGLADVSVRIATSIFDCFDFGGDRIATKPGDHVSYSYHMPYADMGGEAGFPLTDQSRNNSPVMADRNPFFNNNADPESSMNSPAHQEKGQNVLYKDSHVAFEQTHLLGQMEDNIWTYGDTEPTDVGEGAPVDERDAYLVNERQS